MTELVPFALMMPAIMSLGRIGGASPRPAFGDQDVAIGQHQRLARDLEVGGDRGDRVACGTVGRSCPSPPARRSSCSAAGRARGSGRSGWRHIARGRDRCRRTRRAASERSGNGEEGVIAHQCPPPGALREAEPGRREASDDDDHATGSAPRAWSPRRPGRGPGVDEAETHMPRQQQEQARAPAADRRRKQSISPAARTKPPNTRPRRSARRRS